MPPYACLCDPCFARLLWVARQAAVCGKKRLKGSLVRSRVVPNLLANEANCIPSFDGLMILVLEDLKRLTDQECP
ncbi:hypothetical protein L596_005612 [Steinernema carpocapsae]|uniref:Uncharacterized protein n=1 Tax=Steinernema carpocapsae TaxID=34508 RepID=A0A4U8UZM8_STECR|nr:hypothetical protein L596_005612 [Steinernema carpocapsae]